jgi:hypothetical protein
MLAMYNVRNLILVNSKEFIYFSPSGHWSILPIQYLLVLEKIAVSTGPTKSVDQTFQISDLMMTLSGARHSKIHEELITR